MQKAEAKPGKVHPVLQTVNIFLTVSLKHMFRSSCYVNHILQSVRARFDQFQVSKLCPLCREEGEIMQHFILHCVVLEQTRHSFINAIRELVGSVNDKELLRLIPDPSTTGVHDENSDNE